MLNPSDMFRSVFSRFRREKRLWYKPTPSSRKEWIIGGAISLVLLAGGITAGLYMRRQALIAFGHSPDSSIHKPAKPTTEPSHLTGITVPAELNLRPVTGVMIENSPDSRPQSGLKEAGIVFEAIAEGGISRYLVLYQEAQPGNIGPVRSVRPYYLDWLLPFDAAIAHAGGSGQGLSDISSLGVKDLNHNSSAFRRDSSRFAPHNLYSGFPGLDDYSKSKGYTSSSFTSWKRKAEMPASAPSARLINLTVSSVLYNPRYEYDAASNSYKRWLGSAPHKDAGSGDQLSPKVVIAMSISRSQSGIYSVYGTSAGGQLHVFQDGVMTVGTWQKAGRKSQFVFLDGAGQPLALNPGQTWVTMVSVAGGIDAKP